MKKITAFLLSLNTVFGIFLFFMFLLIFGSLSLAGNLALFSGVDETPLFKWLSESGTIRVTWWIYLMVLALALLALSTIFCTAEALLRKARRGALLAMIPPQVMHAGVLFIMLGHLLTASTGYRKDVTLEQGETTSITPELFATLDSIEITTDKNGYDTDWTAKVRFSGMQEAFSMRLLKPVEPAIINGLGIYLRTVSSGTGQSVLIRVCRDPGAPWALAGGLILSAGGFLLLWSRLRSLN
ncbi:MAG: hypothetical protein HZB33_11970 [Nitrospirae bacterium]|nr:hypothetical protein [Nitrospirota bacterium]